MKLDQVSRREVAALHRSLSGKPRTANHVLAFLSSLYAEARRAGLVEVGFTPTRDIQKFPLQARQRFLTEDELARVGEVLARAESDGSEDRYALAAIRLLIFTGCRRNEILDARWDWVDLERGYSTCRTARPAPSRSTSARRQSRCYADCRASQAIHTSSLARSRAGAGSIFSQGVGPRPPARRAPADGRTQWADPRGAAPRSPALVWQPARFARPHCP